jgi:hypothetical protein
MASVCFPLVFALWCVSLSSSSAELGTQDCPAGQYSGFELKATAGPCGFGEAITTAAECSAAAAMLSYRTSLHTLQGFLQRTLGPMAATGRQQMMLVPSSISTSMETQLHQIQKGCLSATKQKNAGRRCPATFSTAPGLVFCFRGNFDVLSAGNVCDGLEQCGGFFGAHQPTPGSTQWFVFVHGPHGKRPCSLAWTRS